MLRTHQLTLLGLVVFVLSACTSAPGADSVAADLVEVESGGFDQVYMHSRRPLPHIRTLAIEEPRVEMSEQWERNHRSDFTQRDVERIKADYGKALRTALTEALEDRAQIRVVANPSEADVIVRPSLLRLNIYAPDLTQPGRRDQYVEAAGNATLDLRLADSETDEILAQFIDHRETPAIVPGRIEETNRGMNYRMFRRLMERWSRHFADYLNR